MLARALAGACAAAMLAAPAGVQAAAPAHWNAVAGDQGSSAIQVTQFLPDSLTVDVGDTITWTVNSGEFHTVTFLSGGPRPGRRHPVQPGGGGTDRAAARGLPGQRLCELRPAVPGPNAQPAVRQGRHLSIRVPCTQRHDRNDPGPAVRRTLSARPAVLRRSGAGRQGPLRGGRI